MKNKMVINEIFAFVSVDSDGNEGIISFQGHDGNNYPLLGADMARIDSLRPIAQSMATSTGMDVNLIRFTQKSVLESINAKATGGCPPHRWDRSGEKCVKCGDKDWMT